MARELPVELIEMGGFMMSCFLHKTAFAYAHNFKDENGISAAEKHRLIMSELKVHLTKLVDVLYKP